MINPAPAGIYDVRRRFLIKNPQSLIVNQKSINGNLVDKHS